jgi:hypothetical protein
MTSFYSFEWFRLVVYFYQLCQIDLFVLCHCIFIGLCMVTIVLLHHSDWRLLCDCYGSRVTYATVRMCNKWNKKKFDLSANYVIIDKILSHISDTSSFWVINILSDSWLPLLLGCLEGHYVYDNTETIVMHRLKTVPEFHAWQVWCIFSSSDMNFETTQDSVWLVMCFMPFWDKVATAWSWAFISNSLVDSWNFIPTFFTYYHASCWAQGQLCPCVD